MKLEEKFNNIKSKVVKFSVNALSLIVAIILLALFLLSLIFTARFIGESEIITYETDNIAINIIMVIVFCVILYFLNKVLKKVNKKLLLIIGCIIISIIGIFWVNYIEAPVKADQKMIYLISLEFLDGDFHSLDKPYYLFNHPLQLGILYFVTLVYKLIGYRSPLVFQNLNIIFAIISTILIYKICNIIFKNEKINRILLILLPMYIILPMMCVMVYGNIVGLMFSLLSIYLVFKYLEDRKIRYLVLATVSLVISILLKQNYQIFLIAIIIILILDLLKKFRKEIVFWILGTVVLVGFINPIIYFITEKTIGKTVNDGIPMSSYIAMGMYESIDRASGWYNGKFNVESVYIDNGYDSDKANEESINVIKDRLTYFIKNPKEMIKYYSDKIASTWAEPTFQTLWFSYPAEEYETVKDEFESKKYILTFLVGDASRVIIKFLDIFEIVVFGSSFIFIITNLKKKTIDYKNIIFSLGFFGGFLFHILWETKCIYVVPFYYLLLPLSAGGLLEIFEFIDRLIHERKENG